MSRVLQQAAAAPGSKIALAGGCRSLFACQRLFWSFGAIGHGGQQAWWPACPASARNFFVKTLAFKLCCALLTLELVLETNICRL